MDRFISYYFHFHHLKHYFECHEIMEEEWKSKPTFNKNDIEVGLILLATSQYHRRRSNFKGADTCLKKAIEIFVYHESELADIGLTRETIPYIKDYLLTETYQPMILPLTYEMFQQLITYYPDYMQRDGFQPSFVDYHLTRDRTELIQLRQKRLMRNKYPVDDTPGNREY